MKKLEKLNVKSIEGLGSVVGGLLGPQPEILLDEASGGCTPCTTHNPSQSSSGHTTCDHGKDDIKK